MNIGVALGRFRQREVFGAVLSVAVIVVAVFLLVSPGGPSDDASVALPGGGSRVRVGEAAPNFRLPTLGGTDFELASAKGKGVWINVWASWCPPCRAEMLDVNEVARTAEQEGMEFVAVNYLEDIASVQSYLANTRYDFPVALDTDGGFADLYRVLGLPSHIFIDANGILQEVRVGSMTRDEMVGHVDALVAGQALVASTPAPGSTAVPLNGDPRTGEAIYNLQCLQCHGGPDGDVRVPGAPPHNGEGHTWHHSDKSLISIILKGSNVGGVMPAFEGQLTEEQVAAVLAYIKTMWSDEQRASQAEASKNDKSTP